jgi:DNA-binding MarR family transcriptional regulator
MNIQPSDSIHKNTTSWGKPVLEPIGKITSVLYRYMQVYISRSLINGKFGLGPGQLYVLLTVAFNEGLCQKEIARKLMIEKATIAKAVKTLVKVGYVRTETDPADRRHMKVFLSDRGHAAMPSILPFLDEMHQTILKGLSNQEIEIVYRLMNRMNLNLLECLNCASKELNEKNEAQ